jgi:hypothetical protein
VITSLTGINADVTDVLRKIKKKELQPFKVMQRGYKKMFNRLSRESITRFKKDKFCIRGDLKAENLKEINEDDFVSLKRFYASLLSKSLIINNYEFF